MIRITLVILAAMAGSFSGSGRAGESSAPAKERIGVYDSRSIAVAFSGSPAHEAQLRRLLDRHARAKAAGDAALAAKIEAEGREQQRKAHQRAFGTASVDEILDQLGDALPEIRKEAGVTLLVSKWDEAELKKHPGAERVDVTPRLVDALHPTERQRRSAIEIQKHKPISSEEAGRSED